MCSTKEEIRKLEEAKNKEIIELKAENEILKQEKDPRHFDTRRFFEASVWNRYCSSQESTGIKNDEENALQKILELQRILNFQSHFLRFSELCME